MRVRVLAAATLVLLLTACGGGGEQPAATDADSPSASPSTPPGSSDPAGPRLPGTAANGDLSRFSCERAPGGAWNASGVLTSPAPVSDYQVTVAVAPDGVNHTKARQKLVANVPKDTPKSFEVRHVPAAAAGGTCRVQVVRLD